MDIAVYFNETFPWNGGDLESGLGGAETAIVYVSRALAARGHRVTVYNRTAHHVFIDGVEYLPTPAFDPAVRRDVIVGVSAVPDMGAVAADVKVHLSMEDDESWVGSYRSYLPRVDAMFAISPYHARLVTRRFGVDPARIETVSLGVHGPDYRELPRKNPFQIIYCSVPHCGLGPLAEVFRLVRRQVPRATLVVTGDLTLWGRDDPGLTPHQPAFACLPGSDLRGKVGRSELVRLQKESVLHLYPCLCNELFCLASLECQAAGTPTVAPAVAALPDVVADGVTGMLVPYPATDPRGMRALADAAVGLLRDPARVARLAAEARRRAFGAYTWDAVAADWEGRFERIRAAKGG